METNRTPSQVYITEKEVSAIIGLAEQTLRNMRSRGDGPPFVRVSRKAIRYGLGDLSEWIEARKVSPRLSSR